MFFFSFSCVCHISCLGSYYHSTWSRGFQGLIMLSLLTTPGVVTNSSKSARWEKMPFSPSFLFLCSAVSALVLRALFATPVLRGDTNKTKTQVHGFPVPCMEHPNSGTPVCTSWCLKRRKRHHAVEWPPAEVLFQRSWTAAQPKQGAPMSLHDPVPQGWYGDSMKGISLNNVLHCGEKKKRDGKILPRKMPQENSEKSLVAYYAKKLLASYEWIPSGIAVKYIYHIFQKPSNSFS